MSTEDRSPVVNQTFVPRNRASFLRKLSSCLLEVLSVPQKILKIRDSVWCQLSFAFHTCLCPLDSWILLADERFSELDILITCFLNASDSQIDLNWLNCRISDKGGQRLGGKSSLETLLSMLSQHSNGQWTWAGSAEMASPTACQ